MKTAFKKIASLLICLCLIISGMVITASAADTPTYTKIDKIADLTAGTYIMSGVNGSVYHCFTGTAANNKDLATTAYSFANGILSTSSSPAAKEIELIAVEGKVNTYYIKVGNNYVVSTAASNRKLTLQTTPFAWTAKNNSKGGITLNGIVGSGSVNIGTNNTATSAFIRSYADENTLTYGVVFFKLDETTPEEPDPTPNPEEPGQGGGETPDPTPDPEEPGQGGGETPDPEEPGQGGGETPDQPAGNTATITFDTTDGKRTELSTTRQVWVENGITITNNKTSSSSNIVDNCNPIRFYKNSIIIVAVSNGKIAQIVFDTNSNDYATAMQNSITSGGTATTSGDKVTFVPTTSSESFEFTLSGGQVRMDAITITYATTTEPETPPVTPDPEEPPVTPEPEEPETEIKGTDVEVGSDLTANYVVTVKPEDIEGKTLEMRFTMNGVSDSVECDPAEIVDGTFTFAFEGIGAQCMSDTITAALVSTDNEGNETVHSTVDYRIKDYAQTLLNDTNSSDELKEFVSDMLRYGDAAQFYRNYNLDNLATKDVTGLVEAEKEKLPTEEDEMSLVKNTENALGNVRFKSATVRFSNINALVIKLNAVTENTKLYVNDELVELDGTTFVTDGINADKYDDTFTFELKEGDELIQTLTYSINAYAFSMQDSSKATMASLARALYAYGASAKAYAETLTTN